MAITITPEASTASFTVFIDYVPEVGTQTTATVYRGLSATGPWVEIRAVDLLGEQAYVHDNAAPLGVNVWYRSVADDGTELIGGPAILPTDDQTGWLKDPGRPWADLRLSFCSTPDPLCDPSDVLSWVGFNEFLRATDATLIEILDDEVAADVWARRKNLATGINFFSRTLAMKRRVYELFTAGGPLLLQLPPVYGWDDAFIQTTGALAEEYITRDQRKPWRRWSAPVRTVRAPVGPVQGTACANWCAVEETFATFADLTATLDTWGDVAAGTTVCP